jgi:hypothetical protein
MAEDSSTIEPTITREQFIERMKLQDGMIDSPTQRFIRIWDLLKDRKQQFTEWDMICFCNEYLTGMTIAHNYLQEAVKPLNNIIYTAHYQAPLKIGIIQGEQWHTLNQLQSLSNSKPT